MAIESPRLLDPSPRRDSRVVACALFLSQWAWVVWWGGLTFYSAIVIPAGAKLLGSIEQGFVTQRVTLWLNAFLGIAIALSLPRTIRGVLILQGDRGELAGRARPRRWLFAWAVLLITLIFLCWWHAQLDELLEAGRRHVRDREQFYGRHRLYLWVTAIQWLAGLICLHESRRIP